MRTNIKGLVDTLDLGAYSGLMALFEAISNAVDAFHDRRLGNDKGEIRIRLIYGQDLATQGGDTTPVIDGVDLKDNGIGFGDAQLVSFEEAYTPAKLKVGGKGVGRFTFLKVFKVVSVRSVFEDDSKHYRREFTFSVEKELEGAAARTETTEPIGTTVSLRGMHTKYARSWPREPEVIAQRIVEHFLIAFASRSCPPMYLEAPGSAPIELNDLFERTVQPVIAEIPVSVGKEEFGLQVFRNRDGRASHDLHYCANGREVLGAKLKRLLPELPEKLLDGDGDPYALKVLLTGEYFDRNANQVRTEIAFKPEDGQLDLGGELLGRSEIDAAVSDALRSLLKDELKQTHQEKIDQIEKFVQGAPEYRVLTSEKYRPLIEKRIPPGLPSDKLDEALLHVRREIEDSVRKEERNVAALMERESYEAYESRMKDLIENMNDVGKAKLADYVAHRRTILDLVTQSLKKVRGDKTYPLEKVLHKMIFPMGKRSKDVFAEQQNLWVIDERLCFHTLLTSDKKLNSIPGLEGTSGKEPDIFSWFYDTPIGVSESPESGAIVIIEFKRPMRDDYEADPAQQIISRFVEIRDGNVKDIEGRPVNSTRLRYIGYLIADLTPSLKRQAAFNYHATVDGEGYFKTLTEGNGYVEIISYDKLIKDANQRNRALFEMLGVHKQ